MELWDREAIELLGPAFIEIGSGHEGQFRRHIASAAMTAKPPVTRPRAESSHCACSADKSAFATKMPAHASQNPGD
jgi:hypothetical protein